MNPINTIRNLLTEYRLINTTQEVPDKKIEKVETEPTWPFIHSNPPKSFVK